ncbi:MucBP domain-containing protein, partial [Enterococcus hulanensis]|uniref:MucBP domain-containing protein n=1 Tax=Enterococcus hulanensis TaxID=2559929 RepID=UPI001A8F566C
TYKATAKSISGYTLKGNDLQTVTVDGNKTITFTYTKNATPVTKYTVTIKHIGSDGKELKKATVTVEKGKPYTAKAETFTGYTLNDKDVQTISAVNADQTLTFNYNLNKYNVTVVHKGSNGKTLETEKAVSVEYGKEHTAKSKTFTGYTLSGSSSQKVTVKGATTITFTYNPNKYNVTVVHKGSNGKILETEKAVSVEYDKEHTAKSKAFTGYTLSGNSSQKVTVKGTTTITFTYNPNKYNVTVVHKGSNGKTLETEKAVSIEYDKEHTAKSKTFTGYTLSGNSSQTVTVKGTTTITFTYNPNKYNVTVVHKGSNGKILETEKAVSIEYDKEHTAKSKAFTGYTLSSNSSQTVTVKGTTTITFTYNPIKYNLTVVHKSNDGTILETEKVITVEYDQEYTAKSKEFFGHELTGNTSQKITVKGNQTITFNYTRAAGIYKVTIVHKGSDGIILETDPIRWVSAGTSYNVDAKEFPGYTLSGEFTQVVNITKDTTITFNYTKNSSMKYKITVKYVDEAGKEIKAATTTEVEPGKAFSMTAPDITGYTVMATDKTKTIASVSKNETVTFRYTKNPVVKYKITVKYVDEAGKEIKTATTTEIDHGKPFSMTAPNITGYTVVAADKTKTIASVTKNETVTFKYNINKYLVTIYHKSDDGVISETETVMVQHGENYTAQAKSYDNYVTEYSSQSLIKVTSSGRSLTFDYKKLADLTDAVLIKMRETIFSKVNEFRASEGLSPLKLDPKLTEAVNIRAEEQKVLYSHTRPNGKDIRSVLDEKGVSYGACGENIAKLNYRETSEEKLGERLGERMFNLWLNSKDGHREAMLADYDFIGVGVSYEGRVVYGVQLFISR